MKESELANLFDQDFERSSRGEGTTQRIALPEDYLQAQELAAGLAQLDLSQGSPLQPVLRERLLQKSSALLQPLHPQSPSRLHKVQPYVQMAVWAILALALTVTLSWALKSLRPTPAASFPQSLSASPSPTATLEPSATPTLEPTLTPTPQAELPSTPQPVYYTVQSGDTLNKIASDLGLPAMEIARLNNMDPAGLAKILQVGQQLIIGYSGPTPTPIPTELGLFDMHRYLREIITRPIWDTLWIEAEIRYPGDATGAGEQVVYVQAWLSKDGRGRVIESERFPGSFGLRLDLGARWITLSDGQSFLRYDAKSGQIIPDWTPSTWVLHPLEHVDPLLEMLFPAELSLLSSDLEQLGNESIADRSAQIVQWGGSLMDVDDKTGILLRREITQPESVVVLVRQIVLNPPLTDEVLHPASLDAVAFEPAPAEPPAGIIPSAQLTGAIATYQDPVVGYAIDYPQGWYTQGDPGGPVTLTSFPLGNEGHGGLSADQAKIDLLPAKPGECSTLQQLVDDTRSQAKIPREEQWLLGGVLPAVRMQIQNDVNGVYGESALLLTVINGRCLRVSGLGDLSQFDAIAASLRPLQ